MPSASGSLVPGKLLPSPSRATAAPAPPRRYPHGSHGPPRRVHLVSCAWLAASIATTTISVACPGDGDDMACIARQPDDEPEPEPGDRQLWAHPRK